MLRSRQLAQGTGVVILAVGLFALIVLLFVIHSLTGYWLEGVGPTQVGVQMQAGKPVNIVGPGVYTDIQPFATLQRIDVSEIPFSEADNEVLTNDQPSPQRIGLTLQGTVRRPSLAQSDQLLTNWSRFSTYYTDNQALVGKDGQDCSTTKDKDGNETTTCKTAPVRGLMQNLGDQAMKVCVGGSTFNDAAIGTGRDKLRTCIDTELNTLATGYGLTVSNIVVPNIIISPQVQQSLDAITKSRYDQQVAEQNKVTAAAQADATAAQTAGQIRADQAKVQEQARQDAVTAGLNQQALVAQRAVIEQQKSNDLYSAQQDVEIQRQVALSAQQKAQASNADTAAIAKIYQDNPAYANQQAVAAQASAFKNTDKVIVPAGTNPNIIIGNGTQPVVQTNSGH